MTLASDLGHSVCLESAPTPGIVHDPLSPLVLGDVAAGRYSVLNHDALTNRLIVQVVGAAGSATYSFDNTGLILINNVPLDQSGNLQDLVNQAQAAAQAAATSASAAETFADQADASSDAAADNAQTSSQNAQLSYDYASAPANQTLPGGGVSSAVSAARAENNASISRLLNLSDPVTADETFQAGFLFTERQVPGGTRIITIPPNIYNSANKQAAWASYKLAAETGSVKVQAAAGGSGKEGVRIRSNFRNAFRIANPGPSIRHPLEVFVTTPDILDGELLMIFHAVHQGAAVTPNINLSNDAGLVFSTLRALPSPATGVGYPDFAVVRAPLVAFAADSFIVTIDEGPYSHLQACDWWVIEGVDGSVPLVTVSPGTANRSKVTTTFANLETGTVVLNAASQITAANNGQFSAFSGNTVTSFKGNTAGNIDGATSDNSVTQNELYGTGYGVVTADGPWVTDGNFSTATAKAAMCSVAYPPKDVPGAGAVQLRLEGGRDTLTVPFGVMELWFQPDGLTVDVRTPKP
jgi:hypothetical protein